MNLLSSSRPAPSKITVSLAILLSGALWFFSIDISGSYGFLVVLAPLPMLWLSLQSSARVSFLSAVMASLIGRLNWLPYLSVLMPLVPLILVTVLPALLFGFYIWLNRWVVVTTKSPWSMLVFPALVSACEFLIYNNQVDGTAAGLAYTQSNYLAVIQIASITGIWGIVFFVSLLPAAIVTGWYFWEQRSKLSWVLSAAGVLWVGTLLFGVVRSAHKTPEGEVSVGITTVDEDFYEQSGDAEQRRNKIIGQYIQQISALAAQDAQYILFPEKIVHIRENQRDSLVAVLQAAAAQSNATIVGGIAVIKDGSRLNLVEFIPPSGSVQEYQKRYHVKGFEGDFEPGTKVGILQGTPFSSGMAICKDLDFPAWLREYQHVDLLFVPAWDFVQDGWLHSRMAVLRGVENGYTIVRAGRQGRLTVSDYRGAVTAEVNAESGEAASLLAKAPIYHVETLYSRWGDWFGWACVSVTVAFVAYAWTSARRKRL